VDFSATDAYSNAGVSDNLTNFTSLPPPANIATLSLDGDGDYVVVPDNSSLHTSDAFTVEAWIYINEHVFAAPVIWKGEMIGWGPKYTYRVCTMPDGGMTWGACVEEMEGWFHTVRCGTQQRNVVSCCGNSRWHYRESLCQWNRGR